MRRKKKSDKEKKDTETKGNMNRGQPHVEREGNVCKIKVVYPTDGGEERKVRVGYNRIVVDEKWWWWDKEGEVLRDKRGRVRTIKSRNKVRQKTIIRGV